MAQFPSVPRILHLQPGQLTLHGRQGDEAGDEGHDHEHPAQRKPSRHSAEDPAAAFSQRVRGLQDRGARWRRSLFAHGKDQALGPLLIGRGGREVIGAGELWVFDSRGGRAAVPADVEVVLDGLSALGAFPHLRLTRSSRPSGRPRSSFVVSRLPWAGKDAELRASKVAGTLRRAAGLLRPT